MWLGGWVFIITTGNNSDRKNNSLLFYRYCFQLHEYYQHEYHIPSHYFQLFLRKRIIKEVSNNDNVNKKNSNNVYDIRGIPKKRKCTKYKVTRIILSIAVLSHTSWLLYKASSARLLAWSRSYHNKIFLLHPYSPCLRCTLPLHFTVHEIKTRRQCWPRERNVRSRLCTSQTASPLWKYCSCCNTGYVLKGGEGIFNH